MVVCMAANKEQIEPISVGDRKPEAVQYSVCGAFEKEKKPVK